MAHISLDDNDQVSPIVSYNEPVHRSVQISGAAVNLTELFPVANRMTIVITALKTNTDDVFLGFSDEVTAAHGAGTGGQPLAPGSSVSVDLAPTSQGKFRDVYAIVGSGTQELRIWEL
jgi:hypothetical protein